MPTSSRQIATEAALAGGLAAGISVLIAPADPWLASIAMHPSWLAVLALSAFYGLRGLAIATPIAWATVAMVAIAVGAPASSLTARLGVGSDAVPLLVSMIVAGAAMVHRNRHRELAERLARAEKTASSAAGRSGDLNNLAVRLQARQDRIDCSISYWRDLASRLEGDDPIAAAQAALELCMARTGASAGLVRRSAGGRLQNLAWRGQWTAEMPVPRDIFTDRTIDAAVTAGRVMLADEVPEVDADDSDVAVPVFAPDTGDLLGVLALRGAQHSRLGAGELADLVALAGWLAAAIAPQTRHPASSATPEPMPAPSARPATTYHFTRTRTWT
ncbi:MAG TPA: hypothetical protein VML75_12430 [Kofleriaceae bacterium]|nr:hypothetical protein [Kofleriaceae bacterium]